MPNTSRKQIPDDSRRDPLSVGANIHRFRMESGLTLKDLAEKSGVSIATISKIENGKNSGGFETIYKIARGLGVLVTEIIESERDGGQNLGGQNFIVHRRDDNDLHQIGIYDYFPQAFRRDGALNPYVMVINTRTAPDKRDWSIHSGEEVVLVASGAIEIHQEGRAPVRLEAGDSACFDSGIRHAFVCAGEEPARIFSVSTRGPQRLTAGRGRNGRRGNGRLPLSQDR